MIGYRVWLAKLEGLGCPPTYGLYSAGLGQMSWQPGINRARCLGDGPPHIAPDSECACGLYAWHEPGEGPPGFYVLGAVKAWGAIEVHHHGFRAQFAEIVALLRPHDLLLTPVSDMAAHYRVPMPQTPQLLQEAAMAHGTPVPNALRPPALPGWRDNFAGAPVTARGIPLHLAAASRSAAREAIARVDRKERKLRYYRRCAAIHVGIQGTVAVAVAMLGAVPWISILAGAAFGGYNMAQWWRWRRK